MQHIGLRRETENGQPLADFNKGNGIDLRIVTQAPESSVCLRFIDPYGDLVVNQLQLPVLISELQQMRATSREPDLRDHITEVLRFLEDSKDVHTYVRFTGD